MPKPKDGKDLAGTREFFTGLQSSFASAATLYEGPLKALFDETAAKLKAVLDGLPAAASDNWCLTDKLDWFFDSLNSCSSLLTSVTLELQKAKTTLASAAGDTLTAALAAGTHLTKATHEEAVTAAVEAAIAKRIGEQGDLIARTQVNSLCSAAKAMGIEEGRKALAEEVAAKEAVEKLVGERKAALTTAGLPLPEAQVEAVLRDTEEIFTAARTLATTRLTAFTEAGLDLPAELAANAWLPEKEFQAFHKTVTGITALKRPALMPSPFATGPEPATGGKRLIA
jgi:hypothetical protein